MGMFVVVYAQTCKNKSDLLSNIVIQKVYKGNGLVVSTPFCSGRFDSYILHLYISCSP